MTYPILQYFTCDHLPTHFREISQPFCDLANDMAKMLPEDNDEAAECLRKLLEAKDCAVRAALG